MRLRQGPTSRSARPCFMFLWVFFFFSPVQASAGARVGPAAVAAFPSGRSRCSHRCPLEKDARSQPGAGGVFQPLCLRPGRGHPTPTSRGCVGLLRGTGWGSAELRRPVPPWPHSFLWGWVLGCSEGKTPWAAGEGGGRSGGKYLPTGCFASPYRAMGWGWGYCPSCRLTQAPADEGEGWRVAFFPTIRPIPLERNPDQTRQVNCQTSARHRINGNDFTASLGIMAQHPRAGLNPTLLCRDRVFNPMDISLGGGVRLLWICRPPG